MFLWGVVLGFILSHTFVNLMAAFLLGCTMNDASRMIMDPTFGVPKPAKTMGWDTGKVSRPTANTELNANTNTNTKTITKTNRPETTQKHEKETLHVLFGMMGTAESLYSAWEVSLKSILVNAPIDADLEIHVLCDEDAYGAVRQRIRDAKLRGSLWRNQITIHLYNVEAYNKQWREFLRTRLGHDDLDPRVSLGGYYRLLAYQVLAPRGVGLALYVDTDVIILANLNDLMRSMDDTKLFQGSATSFCSGFAVINMQRFHEFWESVDGLGKVLVGDQDVMTAVLEAFPESYGSLPIEWARNMGNGYREFPHRILEDPNGILDAGAAGMLHYQGGDSRPGDENYFSEGFGVYCDRTPRCRDREKRRELVERSWGLGDFYTRLTWKWALYFGKSTVSSGSDGFKLRVIGTAVTRKQRRKSLGSSSSSGARPVRSHN